MSFCYADPPYLGCGQKLYGDMHERASDWDKIETHDALIRRLCREFPDGWAMSLSSTSLRQILPLCPKECWVACWVKPFASFKPNVTVAYAWEPVVFCGGRKRPRTMPTVRDWVSECITLKKGCPGAKPEGFCMWLFDLLNMQPQDNFVDLFPGSGSVGASWRKFCRSPRLPLNYAD